MTNVRNVPFRFREGQHSYLEVIGSILYIYSLSVEHAREKKKKKKKKIYKPL